MLRASARSHPAYRARQAMVLKAPAEQGIRGSDTSSAAELRFHSAVPLVESAVQVHPNWPPTLILLCHKTMTAPPVSRIAASIGLTALSSSWPTIEPFAAQMRTPNSTKSGHCLPLQNAVDQLEVLAGATSWGSSPPSPHHQNPFVYRARPRGLASCLFLTVAIVR